MRPPRKPCTTPPGVGPVGIRGSRHDDGQDLTPPQSASSRTPATATASGRRGTAPHAAADAAASTHAPTASGRTSRACGRWRSCSSSSATPRAPLFAGGYVGVDVFFVISGFLITRWLLTRSTHEGHLPISKFYGTRAKRILPAAALTLIVTCIAQLALAELRARDPGAPRRDLVGVLRGQHPLRRRSAPTTSPRASRPSPLQHFWTLAVEEQFYLAWPLILAVSMARARRPHQRDRPADAAPAVAGRRRHRRAVVCVLDPRHVGEPDRRLLLDPRPRHGSWASGC